jgi:hypothetical protein
MSELSKKVVGKILTGKTNTAKNVTEKITKSTKQSAAVHLKKVTKKSKCC